MAKDPLTVSEVAHRSGFAPSALRFYEEKGLIEASRTSAASAAMPAPSCAGSPSSGRPATSGSAWTRSPPSSTPCRTAAPRTRRTGAGSPRTGGPASTSRSPPSRRCATGSTGASAAAASRWVPAGSTTPRTSSAPGPREPAGCPSCCAGRARVSVRRRGRSAAYPSRSSPGDSLRANQRTEGREWPALQHDRAPTGTTPHAICRSWRVWRRCASAPGCTSARATARASCTASGRSSTTRSTRPWPAPATASRSSCTPTAPSRSCDQGRGIPVDTEPRTGLSGVEVVFTKLHAGGKFGGTSYAATGGLHGVGASVVNALSARLDVEVDRGGKTYGMSFRRGEPGTFADRGGNGPDGDLHRIREQERAPGRRPGEAGRDRVAGPVLAGPRDLRAGRRARPRAADRPGAADVVPHPRAGAGDPRRARPARDARCRRRARGDLRPPRRDHRVRRLPRARLAGHPGVAAAGLGHLHRERPGPRPGRAT